MGDVLKHGEPTGIDAVIAIGIAFLIIRQFIWRSAELHRMLRMPIGLLAAGALYLVFEIGGGFHRVAGDWLVLAEPGLVAATGTVMGCATIFRRTAQRLRFRFSGLVLLSFGVNRLAAGVVMRRRTAALVFGAGSGFRSRDEAPTTTAAHW